MVTGATLWLVLIGVDASRITRRLTGTETYTLHVLRHLLVEDQRNDYRLYLSRPLPDGLLPRRERLTTKVIRLPRLWTQVGLSTEMIRHPPDVLFVPSHVLPLITPQRSVVVVYDVGHRFFPRAHGVLEWLYVEWAIRRHVRIATRLLTMMLVIFGLLVWVPLLLSDPHNHTNWSENAETFAIAGAAWILAALLGEYRLKDHRPR